MEPSSKNQEIDRISDLPVALFLHILSFLSTPQAAQTSLLSRHFCHLWEASPTVDLRLKSISDARRFNSMADCALLRRDPSCPLRRLTLKPCINMTRISTDTLSRLLLKAKSLGLQHLQIEVERDDLEDIFPHIVSIKTLESLIIDSFVLDHEFFVYTAISLPLLETLDLSLGRVEDEIHNEFLSRLPSLKKLSLRVGEFTALNLTSQTVRKFKLVIDIGAPDKMVRLSMPHLESLKFHSYRGMPPFSGEMPQLRKAAVIVERHTKKCVSGTYNLVKSLVNVEDLKLDLYQDREEQHPYHTLAEPGQVLPMFPNVKYIRLGCRFHDNNIENMLTLVQNSSSLRSLDLVHKHMFDADFMCYQKRKLWRSKLLSWKTKQKWWKAEQEWWKSNQMMWKSKLPCNQHAHFGDLHISEKKTEVVKYLAKKLTSKSLAEKRTSKRVKKQK